MGTASKSQEGRQGCPWAVGWRSSRFPPERQFGNVCVPQHGSLPGGHVPSQQHGAGREAVCNCILGTSWEPLKGLLTLSQSLCDGKTVPRASRLCAPQPGPSLLCGPTHPHTTCWPALAPCPPCSHLHHGDCTSQPSGLGQRITERRRERRNWGGVTGQPPTSSQPLCPQHTPAMSQP